VPGRRRGCLAGTSDKLIRHRDRAKLEELERHAWELIERLHFYVHEGHLVLRPKTGEAPRDDGPTLKGLGVPQRVLELRAQLLSLYALQRHHLVDESGNTIDITRLIPILRRFGIVVDDE
jgi:hypothetical protein